MGSSDTNPLPMSSRKPEKSAPSPAVPIIAYLTEGVLPGIPKGVHTILGRQRIRTDLGRPLRLPVVAIGNFDGVHLGHQALLQEAARVAKQRGGEAVAFTFDPHPARFFAPSLAPPMLMTVARRAELLGEAGADVVLVEPFTAELAGQSAEAFVRETLVGDIGTQHVVVGENFSYGRGRQGDAKTLAEHCQGLGIGLSIVPQRSENGLVCSSTKIREFVLEGRVEGAHMLLGRPFCLEGVVVRGMERGRTLGFPTANLAVEGVIIPKSGVYAGEAFTLDNPNFRAKAAISIGENPTFVAMGDPELWVEAHLLDFTGDLYGTRLRLTFPHRLRDQRRFPSVDELKAAIHRDVEITRKRVA